MTVTASTNGAAKANAWFTLSASAAPRRRDADTQGNVLAETPDGWRVVSWNSNEAKQAQQWCRLPSWQDQPSTPLLEVLTQACSANDGAEAEQLVAHAIQTALDWLAVEGEYPERLPEVQASWSELMQPALLGIAVQQEQPAEPVAETQAEQPVEPVEPVASRPRQQPDDDDRRDPRQQGRRFNTQVTTTDNRTVAYATKLSSAQVKVVRVGLKLGIKQTLLATNFGVAPSTICNIASGATWGHLQVTPEEEQQIMKEHYPSYCKAEPEPITKKSPYNAKDARRIRHLYHACGRNSFQIASELDIDHEFVKDVIERRRYQHLRY